MPRACAAFALGEPGNVYRFQNDRCPTMPAWRVRKVQYRWHNGRSTKRELPAGRGLTRMSFSSCTRYSVHIYEHRKVATHGIDNNFFINRDAVYQQVDERSRGFFRGCWRSCAYTHPGNLLRRGPLTAADWDVQRLAPMSARVSYRTM
jgi:hypothetical protein